MERNRNPVSWLKKPERLRSLSQIWITSSTSTAEFWINANIWCHKYLHSVLLLKYVLWNALLLSGFKLYFKFYIYLFFHFNLHYRTVSCIMVFCIVRDISFYTWKKWPVFYVLLEPKKVHFSEWYWIMVWIFHFLTVITRHFAESTLWP